MRKTRLLVYFVIFFALLLRQLIQIGKESSLLAGLIPLFQKQERISYNTIPKLEGKVFLVTGANAGLGKSTVKHLAFNGGTVIMACRSLERCQTAKDSIVNDFGKTQTKERYSAENLQGFHKDNLALLQLDLSSLESVRKASLEVKQKFKEVHSFILNAGVAHIPYGLTKDGIETMIGINHFGHFYLMQQLESYLKASYKTTVVVVSSTAHHVSHNEGVWLSLEKLNDEKSFSSFTAYSQSKLANMLYAQELSRLSIEGQWNNYVNSIHPGVVDTQIARHYMPWLVSIYHTMIRSFPNKIVFESDYAALTEVFTAVSPIIEKENLNGKYLSPVGQVTETHSLAKDMKLQKDLWKFTEKVLSSKGY